MAKWKTVKKAGYNVRLPAGMSPSSTSVETAISKLRSHKKLSTGEKCDIVLFTKKTGGRGPVAVQRCAGRKLSTGAKTRWKKMAGRKVCRTKGSGKFKRCR